MQEQGFAPFASRAGQTSRSVVCCAMLALAALAPLWVAAQTTGSAASPEIASARERKVALVVGNSAYETSPLKNPVNDARAVAKMLRELGFDVLLRENLSETGFVDALRVFGNRLRPGSVSLFYFAGHGMQVKGRNYLIPVGASIESEDDVPYRAVDANRILDKMGKLEIDLLVRPAGQTYHSLHAGIEFRQSWSETGRRLRTRDL